MKQSIFFIGFLYAVLSGYSQTDKVKWSFSAKKIKDKTYEIHLTPIVDYPWHIYSQSSPNGGALPTKIIFNKNPLLSIEGKTKEIGKIISKYEEVFEVTVKYFVGAVDFVQVVKVKKDVKTNIAGTVEFMACTDERCLAPKTVSFNVKLE